MIRCLVSIVVALAPSPLAQDLARVPWPRPVEMPGGKSAAVVPGTRAARIGGGRQDPDGRALVVSGDPQTVTLPDGTAIRSIRFDRSIATASTVAARRLRLVDGAVVVYPANATTANQTLGATLELDGTATLRNDNPWTHEAHMLRVDGALAGEGTLIVDGDSDGGVELVRDSRATFRGAVRVDGGMLIPRTSNALGPETTSVTLRGGKLFLPGVTLTQPIIVERDAQIWLGGPSTLLGSITIADAATLTVDSGGGNRLRLDGNVTGGGTLRIRGAANATTLIALAGSCRVADAVRLELAGPGRVVLAAEGHDVTLGTAAIATDAVLRCGDGADRTRFAPCADVPWTGTLIIEAWRYDTDRITFGSDRSALTAAQLARAGFRDPAGQAPGLLRARLLDNGTLAPGERVWPRVDLPFAIDAPTERKRRMLYEVDGLSRLSTAGTPLRSGDTLSFFGDSITWLGGFTSRIERAVAPLDVRVRNRGINGGGVRDLRDGSAGAARAGGITSAEGDSPQAAFADVLRDDRATVAIVLIGINDVNWKGTTDAEFEAALRALCQSARAADARVVLATLMLDGERPDGGNPDDAHIERLAAATRRVAREERATLVDLRIAVIAWLQNHNRRLRLDGTLDHERSGLLTYDGIHLSVRGNALVTELLADGIARALRDR